MYAVKDRQLYINLFAGNTATMQVGGKDVVLEQQTSYPWDGDITITIKKNQAKTFDMLVRIPEWVNGTPVPSDLYQFNDGVKGSYSVKVDGQPVSGKLEKGYLIINRQWKKGDVVSIHFDMPVRTITAHEKVKADQGRIAVERGPLVYCAEGADNQGFSIFDFLMPRQPQFTVADQQINGKRDVRFSVKAISVKGKAVEQDAQGNPVIKDATLTMIPYYAWNHRGPGLMEVWMPQTVAALGNY
jgi:DUF1680 family protein